MSFKYLTPLTTSYINKQYRLFGFVEEINKENFLPIRLSGVDVSIANALRRIFFSEIPTFAFDVDNIKIFVNKSQYNNEVLQKRIGLIAIDNNDLKTFNFDDILFTICDPQNFTEPLRNTTNDIMLVNLHDYLYVRESSSKLQIDTKTLIPYDSLLLTLNPGEEIHVVMKATSGTGNQHSRWQSGIAMYKFETKWDATDHLETNEELMDYIGSEKGKPEAIIITIESVGKLHSYNVLLRGIETLNQKLNQFKQNLVNHSYSEVIFVEKNENIPGMIKLKIFNEDHTLGEILESACIDKLMELTGISWDLPKDSISADLTQPLRQSLISYKKPHPLDNYIELTVGTSGGEDLNFPPGEYDEIVDPSIRLVILAVEDVQKLCQDLLTDASIMF